MAKRASGVTHFEKVQTGQLRATTKKAFSSSSGDVATQTQSPLHPVGALDQILLRVGEICNPREQSDDTPAPSVYASAKDILTEANKISPLLLDATAVEASEGDLLIHWDTPARSVVLICPKNGSHPSIYRETLDGVRPTSSQLLNDASATSLAEALAWVQSPL
jgi:hypothetical protein